MGGLDRELELYAAQNPARRSVDFFMRLQRGNRIWYAQGSEELTFRNVVPEDVFPLPIKFEYCSPCSESPVAFRLTPENAQALMDSLYRAGLRPSDGRSGGKEILAVENHLADMRAIAFSKLSIQPPSK